MKLRVETSPGQWLKLTDKTASITIKAANLALRDVGRDAVKEGRGAIAAAGFSTQWVNSLRLIMFPRGGISLNPVAYIHSTINYSDIFETGKSITGTPLLWLPMPWVPPMLGHGTKFGGVIRRPHMTPSQFVRFVGPLITMKVPGKPPMLGTPVPGRGKLGFKKVRHAAARLKSGTRARELTPMFFAVRSVNIPKKFDATGAMARSGAEENMAAYYLKELEKLKAELE